MSRVSPRASVGKTIRTSSAGAEREEFLSKEILLHLIYHASELRSNYVNNAT